VLYVLVRPLAAPAAVEHGMLKPLRFANGILSGATNGDEKADFEIRIVGALAAADIIL
jgi:hypothetical protein